MPTSRVSSAVRKMQKRQRAARTASQQLTSGAGTMTQGQLTASIGRGQKLGGTVDALTLARRRALSERQSRLRRGLEVSKSEPGIDKLHGYTRDFLQKKNFDEEDMLSIATGNTAGL